MAFAKTLGNVMDAAPDARNTISIFAPDFQLGFQDVVDELGLWTHGGVRGRPEDLIHALNATTGDGGIDLVVFGTCEVDMRNYQDELRAAWELRDDEHKFKVVCIVHNMLDVGWQTNIEWWSRRDSIRLLPIGEHVAKAFRNKFAELADSTEASVYSAGYEHIPVDLHVPVLDIPNLPDMDHQRELSKAVIQGSISPGRRDYYRIFADLITSLNADPSIWGYLPPIGENRTFVPDPQSPAPFQLLIVGSGWLEIPEELAHVVSLHLDLPYKAFYDLIAQTDIVVPAFADFGYFDVQASSTIAIAAELNVPLLATARLRRAYGYVNDARVTVMRPAAMSEVHALRALRARDASVFLDADPDGSGRDMGAHPRVRAAVERMVSEGWMRGALGWREWKTEVWARNRAVVERIMRDV